MALFKVPIKILPTIIEIVKNRVIKTTEREFVTKSNDEDLESINGCFTDFYINSASEVHFAFGLLLLPETLIERAINSGLKNIHFDFTTNYHIEYGYCYRNAQGANNIQDLNVCTTNNLDIAIFKNDNIGINNLQFCFRIDSEYQNSSSSNATVINNMYLY